MPVRLRITLLFALLVMTTLGLVCGGIYYFFYTTRLESIKTRLTNRATTTARLLGQRELFDQKLVQRIDSLTTISLKNKIVQAYDSNNLKIYSYSSVPADTLVIDPGILDDARMNKTRFLSIGDKEVIVYHYPYNNEGTVVLAAAKDADGKQNLNILFRILVLSFLAGIALIFVAAYFFSTRLLQPVKKITSDVKEISVQNLARRIHTGSSNDEWYQLTSTLNELLNRLQESFDLQGQFISNASHELSTPLTSISSQLEVSLQRERDAGEYREVMKSIYQDVRHMSKLTQTLLEFAKASRNSGGLEINPVRIDEIILRIPAEMSKINPLYCVSLQFGVVPENDESLLVFGNEELLLTAIKNIVFNACKYSSNYQAAILMEVFDKTITISISDKGKGIPPGELKTIFEPFYRVEGNLPGEGFGLGLSLADRIIKLHKGAIEVLSELNVGSRFIISLPPANLRRGAEF